MTTATWSSVIDHTGDVPFRTWATEISTRMATVGMVQTADTGQINLTTVTRPGTSTSGGYEIWRYSDSSIYLKLEYGTGSGATSPVMWITVGTGSNGSGTLTGQLSTRSMISQNAAPASTITSYTSYMSHNATIGTFSLAFKLLATASSMNSMVVISRSVDATGATTSQGFHVTRHAGPSVAPGTQSVRTAATAATGTESTFNCLVPGAITSSLVGSDFQVFGWYAGLPDIQTVVGLAGIIRTEIATGVSISVAMVGSTARTYVSIDYVGGSTSSLGAHPVATYSIAMIYQ